MSFYHTYSSELPRWGWIVVAVEAETSLLRRIPKETIHRILESSTPGSIRAAAVFDEDGELIAGSTEWSDWSDQALPFVSMSSAGVGEIDLAFGRKLRHVAYEQLPSFSATIAVVYVADYLEMLLGRFVLLLGGAAVIAFMVVTVVSRQTAALVTAPVHRAARHLIGSTATSSTRQEPGDELAKNVKSAI